MADIQETTPNTKFLDDLTRLLNCHSAENDSGTPDFILASYLADCLRAYNRAIVLRALWRDESVELPALQRMAETGLEEGDSFV